MGRKDGNSDLIEHKTLNFTKSACIEIAITVQQEKIQQQVFIHVMNKNFVGRGDISKEKHLDECGCSQ